MTYTIYPSQRTHAKTIVLSSGLGGHAQFWKPQIDALTTHFHVLTYDHVGIHKESDDLPNGYTLTDMANELYQIIQNAQIDQCYFIGHALGAFIGMELIKLAPQCVEKIIMINPWDQLDPHTLRCFTTRLALLEHAGTAAYIQAQALFLYPPAWISAHDQQLKQQEQHMIEHACTATNIKTRLHALKCYEPLHAVSAIDMPCLIISNEDDFLVPWQRGLALSKAITHSQFELFKTGAHASTVTETAQINSTLLNFLVNTP
ncbi:pyrimidine utilization protein D [Acinetobacter boissieri]|uniref:Aminoacrylate hydrolase n=1 Tax=Acinetobacter boissieri TaxID=1219383 RepID=A0A1G6GNC6_9GAMM|nr:pyrimidine utilization protein D [Acinetobacter boissieri]SDB82686.1 aminoacrylate hydrolase [Acinetobacter boissieri]